MHRKSRSVAELVTEFLARAAKGEGGALVVPRGVAEEFALALVREGVRFAVESLETIECPRVRAIVAGALAGLATGAVVGAGIGQRVAGAPGIVVGAVVGGGLGAVVGAIVVTVSVEQRAMGSVAFAVS